MDCFVYALRLLFMECLKEPCRMLTLPGLMQLFVGAMLTDPNAVGLSISTRQGSTMVTCDIKSD